MQVREWAAEAKFQPKIDNIGPIRGTIQTSPAVSKLSSYQDEKETMSFLTNLVIVSQIGWTRIS